MESYQIQRENSRLYSLLSNVLGWGSLDVNFFLKELDNFEIELGDVCENYDNMCFYGKQDINEYIYCLYDLAYNEVISDLDEQRNIEPEFFLNCLDSHFWVRVNGEQMEFYSKQEFKDYLIKLRESEENDESEENEA